VNDDLASGARLQVRRALREMAMHPGVADEPDPLEALAVLHQLRGAVAQAERVAARRAREDGQSWAQIGEALGRRDDPGTGLSVAEQAWRHVMPGYRGISPDWFTWTCPSCGEHVRDYGPELPPDEAEKGHVRICPQFAATAAAWDASWDDGSDEGSGDGA
jgi:hypothetical protein